MGSAELTWPAVLAPLVSGVDLTDEQVTWAMAQILQGEASPAQISAFLTSLRAKGETSAEVNSMMAALLAHARMLDFGADRPPVILDVVGTGGDHSHSVNISTMSALVCAAAGVTVVKHGNRAASSMTGTADVLEELGVDLDLDPDMVIEHVRQVGMGFCFAQIHHPAMRHAAPVRRELGIPTVFNILGPLTNPARANAALIGCASEAFAPLMAEVLAQRGVKAIVVRGDDGLDEISTMATTSAWDVTGSGAPQREVIDTAALGIARPAAELLRGGDRSRNAELLRKSLGSVDAADVDSDRVQAIRDTVAVNAAAALVAAEAVTTPLTSSLMERIAAQLPRARAVIESGSALALLDRWTQIS